MVDEVYTRNGIWIERKARLMGFTIFGFSCCLYNISAGFSSESRYENREGFRLLGSPQKVIEFHEFANRLEDTLASYGPLLRG